MRSSNRFRHLLGLALLSVFMIAARPVGLSDTREITLSWIKQDFKHQTEFAFETEFDSDGRLVITMSKADGLTAWVSLDEDEERIYFFTKEASKPFAPGTSSGTNGDRVNRLKANVQE